MNKITCAKGTPEQLLNAVKNKIADLDSNVVESACNTSIEECSDAYYTDTVDDTGLITL